MTQPLFALITEWQQEKFPEATPLSSVLHLEEEVKELRESIEKGAADPKEIADCFMLLISVCRTSGLDFWDAVKAISEKHYHNIGFDWANIPEKGYSKRIKK